jgi:hypothetical protein
MLLNFEKGKLLELTNSFLSNSCKYLKNQSNISSLLNKDEGDNYCISDNDYSIRLVFLEDQQSNSFSKIN